MKIIIFGAGALGRLLAERLCEERHRVTVIDESAEALEAFREKLDLLTVDGCGTDLNTLRKAGAAKADVFLAVSGRETDNIVACSMAQHLGTVKTICRLYASDPDGHSSSVIQSLFGIWRTFSSPAECTRKIRDVLDNRNVLEKIHFSNPDAQMVVFRIPASSPLAGARIKDLPATGLLERIRFAALLRDQKYLIPHGDTVLVKDDRLYVAGNCEYVRNFVEWASGGEESAGGGRRILISASGNETGLLLAEELIRDGYEVCIIEKDRRAGEKLLGKLPSGSVVICGDPTDESVLEEAGVARCDAFVGVMEDDEDNILSGVIARRMGAGKTVVISRKPGYIRTVPAMTEIDCGFNTTLISANTVFRLMESGTVRMDASLQQFHAQLTEFKVTEHSPLCGKALSECKLPLSTVFALIFRSSSVIPASGSTVFQVGDTVVAIVTQESSRELLPFFPD